MSDALAQAVARAHMMDEGTLTNAHGY